MAKDSSLDPPTATNGHRPKKRKGGGRELFRDNDSASSAGRRGRHSSEDETVAILHGVLRFKSRTGKTPVRTTLADFYDFVKGSLRNPAVGPDQLYNKLRHLRHKFNQTAARGPGPSDYDRTVHELSARAWGSAADNGGPKMEGSDESEEENNDRSDEEEINGEGFDVVCPYLARELAEYWKVNGFGDETLKLGMKLADKAKAKALEERWVQHYGNELKFKVKEAELNKEIFTHLSAGYKSTIRY